MTINRKETPQTEKIKSLHFQQFQSVDTAGAGKIYYQSGGTEPVIKLDLVFNAGLLQQEKVSISSFAASMLSEGTKNKTGKELLNALDFFGSYFQVKSNEDDTVATLYCLEKHLENCLPLFIEAIEQSIFPDKALETLKRNAVQKLKVNEKKNSFVCRRAFAKHIYGENHPYGKSNSIENIQSIQREELVSFHQKYILSGFKYGIVSGKFSHETLSKIAESIYFQPSIITESETRETSPIIKPGKYFIEKNDSVQAALRIGKHGLSRTNPDFASFQLLNLIFGGYFGSRIMKNIREEKGLTYGIYSSHEINQHASCWYIETEMNSKSKNMGLEEIYKEMKILRENKISAEEIDIARNYLLGSILKSLDNTLSLSNRMKLNLDFHLKQNYLSDFIDQVNKENADSLIETAQKYFTEEGLVEMVVGKN
ncbi:MAG: M16 family metallopeptidase [Bacteroidia bacterium]